MDSRVRLPMRQRLTNRPASLSGRWVFFGRSFPIAERSEGSKYAVCALCDGVSVVGVYLDLRAADDD